MNSIEKDQKTCIYRYTFKLKMLTEMKIDEAFYKTYRQQEKGKDNVYGMMGNAVGGAIRNYLANTSLSKEELFKFMGGVEEEEKQKFVDSSAYISDAEITSSNQDKSSKGLIIKEGTAIDGASGTAKDRNKYSVSCLPRDSKLQFQLEIQSHQNNCQIAKIMGTIAEGIEGGGIRFGGHKNNDFGRATVEEIEIAEYCFNTVEDLEDYICGETKITPKKISLADFRSIYKTPYPEVKSNKEKVTIEIKGKFPYGVYQNFDLEPTSTNKITGIQKKEVPASSLKGLLRHETEKMINTLIPELEGMERKKDEKLKEKMNIIFGGNDSMGKVMTYNIKALTKEVKVLRAKKEEKGKEIKRVYGDPTYLKIDRLTGGKFDKALMTTTEYLGKATIKLEVSNEDEGYLFPILLSSLNIALGRLPIGGRTSIGLGIFHGNCIKIDEKEYKINTGNNGIPKELKDLMEGYYTKFKGWCNEA